MKEVALILILAGALIAPLKASPADKVHISQSAISGSQAILWVTADAGLFKEA